VFTQVREVSYQQCPWKNIFHWANVCFSAHAIFHNYVDCRHTTNETFRKVYAMYMRYQTWNFASAQEWDFTAQMLCWFRAVAHLRGNTGHQGVCAIW